MSVTISVPYLHAAKIVPNRRLLFLNTFSQIMGDHWLDHFDRALSRPGVGLAGATGSWLSNSAGYEARAKFHALRMLRLPRSWLQSGSGKDEADLATPLPTRKVPLSRYLFVPIDYALKLYQYGRYPNPHIRTNAFMLDRSRFLALKFPEFGKKSDVYWFESGRRSMTRQILDQQLMPVVVDRAGKVYDISEWKTSSTFWIDRQANLLIGDNRTNDYAEADTAFRRDLENHAWVHPWDWYSAPRTSSAAFNRNSRPDRA